MRNGGYPGAPPYHHRQFSAPSALHMAGLSQATAGLQQVAAVDEDGAVATSPAACQSCLPP